MDKTEKLKSLRATYKKLGQEIEALENEPKGIDWKMMPGDILVEVSNGGNWVKKYFTHYDSVHYWCSDYISTSAPYKSMIPWNRIRLIENPPQPWFGGECPVPSGIRVRYWLRNGSQLTTTKAGCIYWGRGGPVLKSHEIIAYQILGEDRG